MPGLNESEYNVATDFTIAAAREVAVISQYAAAYRNMSAAEEYKVTIEQIATLARGPKVERGEASCGASAFATPNFGTPTGSTSTFRPIPTRASISSSFSLLAGIRGQDKSGMTAASVRDHPSSDEASSNKDVSDKSNNEAVDTAADPLTQFIRSLRSPSSQVAPPLSRNDSTVESEESPEQPESDSEIIPPSQLARRGVRIKYTKRKTRRHREDAEVQKLTQREDDVESRLAQDHVIDLEDKEGAEDAQEFSQTY